MKGEWCYFKSYFDKQTCEKLIEDAKDIPYKEGEVGVADGGQIINPDYRRSKIKFIYSNSERFQPLFDALWKTAIKANEDFFQFHISRLFFVQFAEYDASYEGEYKQHHDVFWINNDDFYHRKLSCSIQLSDPSTYDGGNLLLTANQIPPPEDIRAQGTITYFPSFMQHQVTPVTRGTRYSLVAWFEGRKWS